MILDYSIQLEQETLVWGPADQYQNPATSIALVVFDLKDIAVHQVTPHETYNM
jgi:hypothetical protein